MGSKIEDCHHEIILAELLLGGTQCTYVTKNRLKSRKIYLKTRHVLMILKKIESLGFASSQASGLGYSWTLTNLGRNKARDVIVDKFNQ